MNKNKFLSLFPVLRLFQADCPAVGGQAVMEGVMMRNGDIYGLAVRIPTGEILAQRVPWVSLTSHPFFRTPFIRGFPILLETLVNGIKALNRSVELSEPPGTAKMDASRWQILLSVFMAIVMAIALFVIAPHVLSLLMLAAGLGGDVEGLSFHLWDGFYKCAIFLLYIWLISFVPDIRRVFEYHGAEHKTIHAWELTKMVDSESACSMSRLHPRCGTTFLLFVICISIILQAILVPLMLILWTPQSMVSKHIFTICLKLLLVAPISAVAYELIRFAARLPEGFAAAILQAPGLALQKLTTRDPSREQIEVALVALAEALGPDLNEKIKPGAYRHMSRAGD